MNAFKEDNSFCYFHPKQIVVGVCPLCLNERLLVLAAKQTSKSSNHHSSAARASSRIHGAAAAKNISLPKIFAVGGSLLNRLDFRHSKSNASDDHDTSTSQEDSFISIKFEENGMASWEKAGTVSKVSLEHCSSMSWNKSVIEHPNKPHASLRWRKRIGHIFHLIKWKRSNKANVCHVGTKVEGVKVRKGWMRTLTKKS